MTVSEIIVDFESETSRIFFKTGEEPITTVIPPYPENTKLYVAEDGYLHPIPTSSKIVRTFDTLFSEIRGRISFNSLITLWKMHYNRNIDALSTYCYSPYHLKNVLSLDEMCEISNPNTARQWLTETRYIIDQMLTRIKNNTGSTCIDKGSVFRSVRSFLQKHHKTITKDEFNAVVNYCTQDFTSFNYNEKDVLMHTQDYTGESFIYDLIREKTTVFPKYKAEPIDFLSEEQNLAVQRAVGEKGHFALLTGGAGTGKTTIIKEIVSNFRKCYPENNVALLAPTGKAVNRIKEVFAVGEAATKEEKKDKGVISISTIHHFLAITPMGTASKILTKAEKIHRQNYSLIIIDEASMLDYKLFISLVQFINMKTAKIILVGDSFQLPSIEAGALLRDLTSLKTPTYALTHSYRSGSAILENAEKIKNGDFDLITSNNFIIDEELNVEDIIDDFDKGACLLSPYKTQKITPSTYSLNKDIHNILFKDREDIRGDFKFKPMESVIVTETQYTKRHQGFSKYTNGDVGFVQSAEDYHNQKIYYVISNQGKSLRVPEYALDFGYAITIHKSQGSEYPIAHISIPFYSDFITRKMLYTAVTRAKEKVVLHTTTDILCKIIKNDRDDNRETLLSLYT